MTATDRAGVAERPSDKARELITRLGGKGVSYPLGYMASLDGARGLLTLGVMLAHTRPALFQGAIVYMDVFFAMSGYLITSLLIKDHEKNGRISLKKFYARRFLRLYPALTAMVVCFIALSFFFSPAFPDRLREALLSWIYLTDFAWAMPWPFTYTLHTWSLAIEEQFYVLWPLLFIGLLRLGGISVRVALAIFAAAAAFWLWRIWIDYNGASIEHLYMSLDTRADSLLIGCGLAVLLKAVDVSSYPRFFKFCAASLLPFALALIVIGLTIRMPMRWYYCASPLFGAIPGAIAVIGMLHPERSLMHRIYEHPVPIFIGRICYALYIWHVPVFIWVVSWAPHGRFYYFTIIVVGWPIAFAIATLSHYFIERPFMRVRPGF